MYTFKELLGIGTTIYGYNDNFTSIKSYIICKIELKSSANLKQGDFNDVNTDIVYYVYTKKEIESVKNGGIPSGGCKITQKMIGKTFFTNVCDLKNFFVEKITSAEIAE